MTAQLNCLKMSKCKKFKIHLKMLDNSLPPSETWTQLQQRDSEVIATWSWLASVTASRHQARRWLHQLTGCWLCCWPQSPTTVLRRVSSEFPEIHSILQWHLMVAVWHSGSGFDHINEVAQCLNRLALGWMTASGVEIPVVENLPRSNQPPRSTQHGHPFVGRHKWVLVMILWPLPGKKRRVLRDCRACNQDCWHTGLIG